MKIKIINQQTHKKTKKLKKNKNRSLDLNLNKLFNQNNKLIYLFSNRYLLIIKLFYESSNSSL